MKKYIVLGVLFILPIVVYLFFASGVNNFGKLPVLQQKVENIGYLKDSEGEAVDFKGNITVLGFLGKKIESKKLNAFNLNQKIYKRFNGFKDFQFITLVPAGTEEQVQALKNELSPLANVSNWHFVFASEEKIESVFKSLQTPYSLDENLYTPYVFIIDKDVALRGRLKDDDAKKELFGYDATSVAVINNKMIDDIKVLLAEYRLALKNNGSPSKRGSYLKYNQDEE
ncbi:hypothetical protein [Galbibacter pacificus]|uniref:Uncharacterized protein n=1 Tax=Galbibacter pacificus TaxID=2996052 RepID=A0ABT6FSR2_9FLAO|nr:hypothetical protein [Galbibacter pacificus]MDG3582572.1 hypothetical protein [Galbibacter pacificus]MDG3586309.1 hypothetical protein [Galbibacter pacificus]